MKIPLECPFHPLRDIFGPQQAAKKQNRPSQWTCGFCGKSFYEEKHLDLHFEARHHAKINTAEDAICLANYCDIMRCKVLVAKDSTLSFGDSIISTDIELWNEATAYRTALSTSGPRDLAKLPKQHFLPSLLRLQSGDADELQQTDDTDGNDDDDEKLDLVSDADDESTDKGRYILSWNSLNQFDIINSSFLFSEEKSNKGKNKTQNEEDDDETDENDSNATSSSCDGNLVDSTLPPADKKQQRLTEFQRLKANCKSDDLEKLKLKCEILVRDCIAGLLVHLSNDDFKSMEGMH